MGSEGFPSDEEVVFRRGLSGRPLHPFGRILLKEVSSVRFSRGLSDRSATSIVAAYSRSFRLMRSRTQFAPLAQVRSLTSGLLRGSLYKQQFSPVRHCRGLCGRPLHPFAAPLRMELNFSEKNKLFSSRRVSKSWAPKGSKGRPESPLEYTQTESMVNPSSRVPEGFQGAIGKPLGSISNVKKLLTHKAACPKGSRGRGASPRLSPLVKIENQRHVRWFS